MAGRLRTSWCILFSLSGGVFPVLMHAQFIQARNERIAMDTLSAGFDRVLNTFVWKGQLGVSVVDDRTSLVIRQNLRSRFIRTDPVSSQGEYSGLVDIRSRLLGNWSLVSKAVSLVVSDNRSIDLGRMAQHQGLLGLEFSPQHWRLSASGGYELNDQESERDQGFAYSASLESKGLDFEGLNAKVQSSFTKSFLGRRSPEQHGITLELGKEFGPGASDTLMATYSKQRREFYTGADQRLKSMYAIEHYIFKRDAESFEVANQLDYRLGALSRMKVRTGVNLRAIERGFRYKNMLQPSTITLDSRINEMQLSGSVSLSSQLTSWLRTEVGLSYQERDEQHSVLEEEGVPESLFESQELSARRLENTSHRTSLSASMDADLTDSDRMILKGSSAILRYDTPDSLNTDDRDELLLTMELREIHRFNPFLTAEVTVSVTLAHLVYLHRLQSANNYWNRVLLFSPRIDWQPTHWLRSTITAEVLANYTVYDFEEQVASVKSFSFRQASWSDSTTIGLSQNIDFRFLGMLRLYERGLLRWSDFQEKPLDYYVEQSYWPQILYQMSDALRVSVGYRLFSQDHYTYQGSQRVFDRTILTSGPTVDIQWYSQNGTYVLLSGWRETSSVGAQSAMDISNMSLGVRIVL